MTDARVEKVYEDRVSAREFLAQADLLFADAGKATLSAPSQAILLHNDGLCVRRNPPGRRLTRNAG